MDIIYIRELEIETTIGIFEWEKAVRQTVSLDLEFSTDNRRAAASDKIEDALDYKRICKRIIGFVEDSRFELVETLAEEIVRVLQEEFGIAWVRLRLGKPGALRGSRDVGVVIERGSGPRDGSGGAGV